MTTYHSKYDFTKTDELAKKLQEPITPERVQKSIKNLRFRKMWNVRKRNGKTKSRDVIRTNKKPKDTYKLLS